MAGFHPGSGDGNTPGGYCDQSGYVDFDQFMSQHNMRQRQYYNGAGGGSGDGNNYRNNNNSYGGHHARFDSGSPGGGGGGPFNRDQRMYESSNLMATASEFVPMHQMQYEYSNFMPPMPIQSYNNDYHGRQQHYHQPSSNFTPPVEQTRNYAMASDTEPSDSQRLLDALNATTLNDRNAGAVKKSHANGSTAANVANVGKDGANRWTGKSNGRGSYRRGGTGRTASQYDDMYYSKHFSDESANGDGEKPTYEHQHHRNNHNNNHGGGHHHQQQQHRNDRSTSSTSKASYNGRSSANEDKSSRYNNNSNNHHQQHHHQHKANRNNEPKANFDSDQCSQRDKLIREIDAGKLECLVCCENIRPFQSAWSCNNCYHIIHFNCLVKWAASSKSDEGWRCPACQNITVKVPQHCYCFCGKQRDPPYNRNDVAHTCGEVCGRTDGCSHACTLLCHPGPCPPCQATVTRKCGCGRTERSMQCCQQEEMQCTAECGRTLACGVHQCTQTCHVGECAVCEEKLEHKCHCGKDKREVECTAEHNEQTRYACGKLCNRALACKNHKCKDICHAGECQRCRLSADLVTSCPCGKVPIRTNERQSCADAVPLCGGVCGKPLKCGAPSNPHQCTSKCHAGNCAACGKETAVKCRCGHMDQLVKCKQLSSRADDARCKKRCTRKRNCGKHKCNQECCIDIDHICPMPCNHSLTCGKHKCDQTCHRGHCRPCYRSSFDELYCECGANVIYPPVACGTKRPPCDRPCSRSHPCEHPVQHNCHSATTCPPCMAFTTKYCHGKHEQRKTIPCSQADFSCGLPCNRQLRCGQHKCLKACHSGDCEREGEACRQLCPKPRIMCAHNCNAPCHGGDCPDIPCRESVEVLCQCGNRKQQRKCHDFAKEYQRMASMKFASTMEDMQRGTVVELSDVLGPIKMAGNNKT